MRSIWLSKKNSRVDVPDFVRDFIEIEKRFLDS